METKKVKTDISEKISRNSEKTILDMIKEGIGNAYFQFVVKKALFYSFVLFIAISLAFLIPRLLPGDPLRSIITPPAGATDQQIAEFLNRRQELVVYLGLDKPIWEQYIGFWINLFQFDLGPSYTWNLEPVLSVVSRYLPYTILLVVPAVFITFYLGNWIGGRLGFHKSKPGTFVYYLAIFLQSAPFYWLSLFIVDIFIVKMRLVPYVPAPDFTLDPAGLVTLAKHFFLPFITLIICFTGGWATGMRSMTIYELNADYMLYAEKLGFRNVTLRRYAQRNAILPQFTGLNLRFSEILGATLIVEMVFLWPGLGKLTYDAFLGLDYPLIIGTFIITIIIVVVGNFLIDIAYGFIDPRIRTGYNEG